MARIETDPNYTSPTFSRATAATDPFKKEDVQNLAAAFSTHVHDGVGKGLAASMADWFRAYGKSAPLSGPSGPGLELYYDAANGRTTIASVSEPSGTYVPNIMLASGYDFTIGGVASAMQIANNRAVSIAATLTVTGATTLNAALSVASNIACNGNLLMTATNNMQFPHGGTITDYTSAGYVSISNLNVPGNATIGGTLSVTSAITGSQVTVPNSLYANGCVINNGTNNQGVYLYVNGPAGGTSGWNVIPSSINYKSNVVRIDEALDLVKDDTLHGVHYTVTPEGSPSFDSYGFLAEPWNLKAPDLVNKDEAGNPQGMDYGQVIAICFEALKQYVAATDARLAAAGIA